MLWQQNVLFGRSQAAVGRYTVDSEQQQQQEEKKIFEAEIEMFKWAVEMISFSTSSQEQK